MEKQNLFFKANSLIFGYLIFLIGIFFIFCSNGVQAYEIEAYHRLHVELIPGNQKLKGLDHIRVNQSQKDLITILLSEKSQVKSVIVNNQKVSFQFANGLLLLHLDKETGNPIDIHIEYEAIFDDPAPHLPVNTDNPGYGVSGIISDKGCLLLSGSGWRPVIPDSKSSIFLTVKAPKGMLAVTAGRFLGEAIEGNHTISRWEVNHPVKGLSLSAGYYRIFEKQIKDIVVSAFFYPESSYLADEYLNAASGYIHDYSTLFGPYPFPKFAIVENFFPTGYGFASYTLIGSQVLRLPFILDTSLGHEIAHCWWGNGVYPDYSRGNWSEGLTTYVAEHLFKEQQSDKDAREYRLEMLRNYTTLTNPSNDFPLARFSGRVSPSTKVIGYDKGAMFFHMLRKEVGDVIFWNGLRDIFKQHLFSTVSWNNFRVTFESLSGKPLKTFFEQWINREGAPQFSLEDVHVQEIPSSGTWQIRGKIVQKPPFYRLNLPIMLETDRKEFLKTISLENGITFFEIMADSVPQKLSVDPDVDIFRKLSPSEIPATINSLKASDSVLVVLAKTFDHNAGHIPKLLMQGLGIKKYQIVYEKDLHNYNVDKHDLLLIGLPSSQSFFPSLPEIISVNDHTVSIDGTRYGPSQDLFFGVFPHISNIDRITALLLPFSTQNLAVAVRKIPHYGKYSYLVFGQGQNMSKGIWPIEQSPLVFNFDSIMR